MATDFELQVLQELGEIKSTGAATAASFEALNDRLFTGNSAVITVIQKDVQDLQDAAKDDIWWDRAKVATGPIAVGIHMLLHKLGIKV